MEKIAIVGVEWDIVDLIDSIPHLNLIGFIDVLSGINFKEFACLGKDSDWEEIKKNHPGLRVVLPIDNPGMRERLSNHYGESSRLNLLSPHAHISPRSSMGSGTIIQRGSIIMPNAIIGNYCKINVNATIHHDSKIGNFCTLAPGAQILGKVVLEDGVYIGAGAVIRQCCRIGAGTVVGAGAVVVQDIPSDSTVVGVPAKEMKKKLG